jgi:hypothetical protein
MRKALLMSYLWLVCAFTSAGQPSQLFISEYIEGSSYNKAIELYNGTDNEFLLNNENENGYFLLLLINPEEGEDWEDATLISFIEGYILEPDSCYVICHSSSSEEMQSLSQQTSGQIRFNGNDPVALVKDKNANQQYDEGIDQIVDVVGDFSGNNFAQNVTLVRLPGYEGNNIYSPSEWQTLEEDDFSDLGVHNWGTTKDTLAPQIDFWPENNSKDVDTLTEPAITFNEPIYHASGANIEDYGAIAELTSPEGIHTSQYIWDEASLTITIVPEKPLYPETEYTISLIAIEDAAGNETHDTSITFITQKAAESEPTAILTTTQPESSSIASVQTTEPEAAAVFSFLVKDQGTYDTVATRINQISFFANTENNLFLTDTCIAGYYLQSGTGKIHNLPEPTFTNNEQIRFNLTENPIEIANGTEQVYTLYIWLQIKVPDNIPIRFMIPQDSHGFEVADNSSPIQQTLAESIYGNEHVIKVSATEIQFTNQPTSTEVGATTEEKIQVIATDKYSNIDTDYQKELALTSIPAEILDSTHYQMANEGIANFHALEFTQPYEACYLQVTDGKFTAQSEAFNVTEAPTHGLLFTEYIEGSGYNKALEVGNCRDEVINLEDYEIRMASNGGEWKYSLFPQGNLDAGKVFVIAHSKSDASILEKADTLHSVANFNGDDALALFYQGEIIDVIGTLGEDPGSGWQVAGTTDATKDHSLLRKGEINSGTSVWPESAGTETDNSQWIVKEKDYAANLGKLTQAKSNRAFIRSFTLAGQIGATLIDTIDYQISVIMPDTLPGNLYTPSITVSEGASVDPPSGMAQDFSNPVEYTVTAEDLTTQIVWTVTVSYKHIPLPDLYFSEYTEGDLYNRAIELFNPTRDTLNLHSYRLVLIPQHNPEDSLIHMFASTNQLLPNGVFTLVHNQFKQYQLPGNRTLNRIPKGGILDFNGNDCLVLQKMTPKGIWQDIDLLGSYEVPFSMGWSVDETINATFNHTLMRKHGILYPTTDWMKSAGDSVHNSEWIVQRNNHTANLGLPTPNELPDAEIVSVASPGLLTNYQVSFINHYATLTLYEDADLTNLPIEIELSPNAISSPSSGNRIDASKGPIAIYVEAENGETQTWWLAIASAYYQTTETTIAENDQEKPRENMPDENIKGKARKTKENIRFYPIPVQSQLTIESTPELGEKPTLWLYSSDGVLLRKVHINSSVYKLDMHSLPAGIYVIKINSKRGTITQRIVKE